MVHDLTKQRLKQHVCKRVQICVCTSDALCDNNLTGRHTLNRGRKAFDAGNGFCAEYPVFLHIADPPILSSSAENGSATAMQGRS